MRHYIHFILLVFVSMLPTSVEAVYISEVAWMGSATSANHEWIELHNPGEDRDVSGWTLRDGMNLTITLTGVIPAGAYAVLERNRSDGGSVVGTPFLTYTGALVNTGATLTLRDGTGNIVDQVAGGDNWQSIGGDNGTKETAQYTGAGWVTATPTPGRSNATAQSQSTTSPPQVIPQGASSGRTSGIITGAPGTPTTKSYQHLPWQLALKIIMPTRAQVGQPLTILADASGLGPTHLASLIYTWNFGDLTTGSGATTTHTYYYPGSYIVTLHAEFAGRSAVVEHEVTVVPVALSVARVGLGDVQLYNDAMYDIDISGYVVQAAERIVFPPRSYMKARSTITIPYRRLGNGTVVVYDNQQHLVTSSLVPANLMTTPSPTREVVASGVPSNQSTVSLSNISDTSPGAFRFAGEPLPQVVSESQSFGAEDQDSTESEQSLTTTVSPPFFSSLTLNDVLFVGFLIAIVILILVMHRQKVN